MRNKIIGMPLEHTGKPFTCPELVWLCEPMLWLEISRRTRSRVGMLPLERMERSVPTDPLGKRSMEPSTSRSGWWGCGSTRQSEDPGLPPAHTANATNELAASTSLRLGMPTGIILSRSGSDILTNCTGTGYKLQGFRIRIGLNTDPDPEFRSIRIRMLIQTFLKPKVLIVRS